MKLYHYTCSDGVRGIERDHLIRPHPQPILNDLRLSWFTDLMPPDRNALGLTSHSLSCDRTRWAYEVDPWGIVPWIEYRKRLREAGMRRQVSVLETAPGVMPRHWWVADQDVTSLRLIDWRFRAVLTEQATR